MFTSRGYRQAKRENRNKSRQGQIIQQKPVFQIDNNPVVIEAYKKFIFSSIPSKMLIPTKMLNSFECILADYGLIWNTMQTALPTITEGLISFAGIIFDRMDQLGKYCVSLELYSPNLNNDYQWIHVNNSYPKQFVAQFSRIIIDRNGTLSWVQKSGGATDYVCYAANVGLDILNVSLAFGPIDSMTLSNPTKMKVDINYYTIWSSN